MGVRIEIHINPEKFTCGLSYLEQIGRERFRAVVFTKYISLELESFVDEIAAMFGDKFLPKGLGEISERYVIKLLHLLDEGRKDYDSEIENIIKGRIKHEYHHLEQNLTVGLDEKGRSVNMDETIRLQKAYRRGDHHHVLNEDSLIALDHHTAVFRALMELDAIVVELEKDSLPGGQVNVEMLTWRICSSLGFVNQKDSMFNVSFPHRRAMLALLSGRLDLIEMDMASKFDFDEVVRQCIPSLRQSLDKPQDFLNHIQTQKPVINSALVYSFRNFLADHKQLFREASGKGIIPEYS